jgi:hypothetical protein
MQTSLLRHNIDRVHILGWRGLNLDDMLNEVMSSLGNLATEVDLLKCNELHGLDRECFARQALSVKHYGDPKFEHLYSRDDAAAVLSPRREADRGDSLWHLFNVAQENLLSKVNEVTKNRVTNLKLWEVAKGWCN